VYYSNSIKEKYMRYAVINLETGIVENIIIWDGNGMLSPFSNDQLIQIRENEFCDIGYTFTANDIPRFSA